MNSVEALEIAREAILVMLGIGAPVMLIALAVGLVVSLFQALTQIQEMTLAFVPKILVIFVTVLLLLPSMLTSLTTLTERLAERIVTLG